MKKIVFILLIILVFTTALAHAQGINFTQRFNNGAAYYNQGRYQNAAIEFRRAQEMATNEHDWAGSTYWVILSQLAATDYGSALIDMAELERKAPNSVFNRDMAYHRARVYFNQGHFENALLLFKKYIDSVTETGQDAAHRKAAAYYWMGECLFAMGQMDEAEKFYSWILGTFPESPKKDISSYRIDLIKQKKIEAELLALLQWSHEESLRSSEDYQRKLRTYEVTINSYQRRIAELSQNGAVRPSPVTEEIEEYMHEEEIIEASAEETVFEEPPLEEFMESVTHEYHEELLEKARKLGDDIQRLIKNTQGESW